ncbi:MAG: ABC transporter substrate-binding protein [Alphaproteobacteria bacterium]|nr:ABC transporter substrate-binding protein [Alphaproteobacteria bacterium]
MKTRARPALCRLALACLALAAPVCAPLPGVIAGAQAQQVDIPILVPLSGFLAFEGQSQRNGALLAMQEASATVPTRHEVADTGASPEVAVNALQRALEDKPVAVIASMLGTQMLAMLPIAADNKVPLITISGTAKITELGNPWVFRFFPGDNVVKVAHARYVVEELGAKHPAIIYQNDAYGQSGRQYLAAEFAALGVTPVLSEGVDVAIKDLLPVLSKAKAAGADVIVSHLHVPSSALLVKQAASSGLGLRIVSGSAIATPSAAALLEPAELKGVCAESSAAPLAPDTPDGERFLASYRKAFHDDPDAYALGQYDGAQMLLTAIGAGARTPEAVRAALATGSYKGVAMTYRSDGAGNMAHSAVILCYDGSSRLPHIVKRYDDIVALK